ncbi:SRPBCC domain-containing protein [Devosia sp.]|uniref:SRPBCC family protein n=1 Tax=Devosia sp. TaxID=1871048 RepID=UPI001AC06B17|nr:SRPBCC domain-containing protein [Devosia sp.]MBN9335542.1 SRPBCC domain-containing protein [Devosia sp.]
MTEPTFSLGRGFTLTRTFEAPPDMVFSALTEPQNLGWFFNPGFTSDLPVKVDLRVGGSWRQEMIVNAETRYMTGGIFREIEPGRKLVFTWGAVDGWPKIDPENLDQSPQVTILFRDVADGTQMIFRVELPDQLTEPQTAEWMSTGMLAGWTMTIDRLVFPKK